MPQLCCWVFVCLSFSQSLSAPPGVPVLRSYMGKQEPEGCIACHFTEQEPGTWASPGPHLGPQASLCGDSCLDQAGVGLP